MEALARRHSRNARANKGNAVCQETGLLFMISQDRNVQRIHRGNRYVENFLFQKILLALYMFPLKRELLALRGPAVRSAVTTRDSVYRFYSLKISTFPCKSLSFVLLPYGFLKIATREKLRLTFPTRENSTGNVSLARASLQPDYPSDCERHTRLSLLCIFIRA